MQGRFWCGRLSVGTKPVWRSRFRDGTKLVLEQSQSRIWSRHKASLGAAGYKTGLVSRHVLHLLSKLQNWICPQTGQYKTCLESNTKIDCVYIYIFSLYIFSLYIYVSIYNIYTFSLFYHIYTYMYKENIFIYKEYIIKLNIYIYYGACSKTGFVPTLNQPLQNRLCTCSKTGFVTTLNQPLQNRLCAVPKPAAPKPTLCLRSTCRTKTGFASALNLPFHFE